MNRWVAIGDMDASNLVIPIILKTISRWPSLKAESMVAEGSRPCANMRIG